MMATPEVADSTMALDCISGKVVEDIHQWCSQEKKEACIAELLDPKSWVDDRTVEFYLELLGKRSRTCHFFSSFFYTLLVPKGRPYNHENVQSWTKTLGYCLSDCDKIIIPVHENDHWCLVVVDNTSHTIRYLDSMAKQNWEVLSNIERYMMDECQNLSQAPWTLTIPENTPQQQNGYDCGIFMLKMADLESKGAPLLFSQEDMPGYRREIACAIAQGYVDLSVRTEIPEPPADKYAVKDVGEGFQEGFSDIMKGNYSFDKTFRDMDSNDQEPAFTTDISIYNYLEVETQAETKEVITKYGIPQGDPDIQGLPMQDFISDQDSMADHEDCAQNLTDLIVHSQDYVQLDLHTQEQLGEEGLSKRKSVFPTESIVWSRSASRESLPPEKAASIMKKWYDDHSHYPYLTDGDLYDLAKETGFQRHKVQIWFSNERTRRKHVNPQESNFKSRNSLPERAIEELNGWVRDHGQNPTTSERQLLADTAGITLDQVSGWFMNYRKKRKIELKKTSL